MIALVVELSINGAAYASADSLGWSVGTLTRRSFAADELSLSRALPTLASAATLVYGDALKLRVNGTVVFSGEVQAPSVSFTESGGVISVQVLGPWHQMTRVLFTRTLPRVVSGALTRLPPVIGSTFVITYADGQVMWNGSAWVAPPSTTTYKWARDDNPSASPPEVDVSRYLSTRGLLFDPDRTVGVSYRTVISEVLSLLEYFSASYVSRGEPSPLSYSSGGITTALGSAASPRFRTFSDRSVASLLTDALAAKPDAATWFDYTTTPPTLHIEAASEMDAETLTLGTAPLSGAAITPRPDLVPSGIIVRWEYNPVTSWLGRGYAHPLTIDAAPTTALPHDVGVIVHSIPYETPLMITTGTAAAMLASISQLRGSGSVSLSGFDVDLDAAAWRPALALTIAGSAVLAGVELLVQSSSWDIYGGSVELAVGYPQPLDFQSARDLRGWLTLTVQGWPFTSTRLLAPSS